MPSIFGIGLSRTGTTSLTEALQILGYDAIHWPLSVSELEAHEAATDITVSCRFKELDNKYPGSKFIYTIRDEASWIMSCEAHWKRLKGDQKTSRLPVLAEQAEITIYQTLAFDKTTFLRAYQRHHASVMAYFSDRPDDLLILNLFEGDGWNKLCGFLKQPIPPVKFPHDNKKGAPFANNGEMLKAADEMFSAHVHEIEEGRMPIEWYVRVPFHAFWAKLKRKLK